MMHTVVGGQRVHSPDNNYVLGSEMHGASGKAFSALTNKRVYLWIATTRKYGEFGMVTNKSVTLLDRKYVVAAADLGSHVEWHGADSVTVDLFDAGDGVLLSEMRGMPSNHIMRLIFQLDKQRRKFVERMP